MACAIYQMAIGWARRLQNNNNTLALATVNQQVAFARQPQWQHRPGTREEKRQRAAAQHQIAGCRM